MRTIVKCVGGSLVVFGGELLVITECITDDLFLPLFDSHTLPVIIIITGFLVICMAFL